MEAARQVFEHIGAALNVPFFIRLWDGALVPLGEDPDPNFFLSINDSDVLGSLLRWPTYENLLFHYLRGRVEIHGDLFEFAALAKKRGPKNSRKPLNRLRLLRQALPLLFARSGARAPGHTYAGDAVGRKEQRRDNKKYIQFHYDIGNDFYALFLDPEMLYSCAYFTRADNTLAQAQQDKLDMICKKLRLKPGEKFLDIGSGWGGLLCHAAQRYGVRAHGVTLAENQFDYTREKIKRLGLEDRVTVELRDYASLQGCYDKIASIGMFEHVGIANMPAYFKKINSLLRDRGILLNHGLSKRTKTTRRKQPKISPERRLILKYVFPGHELDNVGHTAQVLECSGFEVHDIEAWRMHYAKTTRLWYERLMARKEEAILSVGPEKFRTWTLYLAGVSLAFTNGALHICQVVATKHAAKGPSEMPLTRADLYE